MNGTGVKTCILVCWLNWGYSGTKHNWLTSHSSCLASEAEERSGRKWKKEGSLARSLFFMTVFQFTQWLMQEQLLPALLHARQSHVLLRDAIFKEQLRCTVQRNLLNRAQKVFADSFAQRRRKQTPKLLQGETFLWTDFACLSKNCIKVPCGKSLTPGKKD